MKAQDVLRMAVLKQFRGTRLLVFSGDQLLFSTEGFEESDAVCDLLLKLLLTRPSEPDPDDRFSATPQRARPAKKKGDLVPPPGPVYFLTLLSYKGADSIDPASMDKRYVGVFSDTAKAVAALCGEITESGHYNLAVVEKLMRGGYQPVLDPVGWWRWDGKGWTEMMTPAVFARAVNFAIG